MFLAALFSSVYQNWKLCQYPSANEQVNKACHIPTVECYSAFKIAGRNINNLKYADVITLMAESEEELKSFLMRVKEESGKAGLKLNIEKN